MELFNIKWAHNVYSITRILMSEMKAFQILKRLNHTQHEIFAFEMVILLAYLWSEFILVR